MVKERIINETKTISLEEYNELIECRNKLEALEGCGVDNWDGYDDAMESLEGDK